MMRTLAISQHLDLPEQRHELQALCGSPGLHCGQPYTVPTPSHHFGPVEQKGD